MKEIKRYGQKEIDCFNGCDVEEQKDGRYVKYTDHKAVVETMRKRIDELEGEKNNTCLVIELKKNKLCCQWCGESIVKISPKQEFCMTCGLKLDWKYIN